MLRTSEREVPIERDGEGLVIIRDGANSIGDEI